MTTDSENNENSEETVVWPYMVVVANIPIQYKETIDELKDEWRNQGYNPIKVHPLGFLGFSVVEFGGEWYQFGNAKKFVKVLEVNKHGRKGWYDEKSPKDSNLYAWIAREEDYKCNGLVGEFLKKNGVLKTLSEIKKENEEKTAEILMLVERMLEEKKRISEAEKTEASMRDPRMASYWKQKEMLTENLNREYQLFEEEVKEQIKKIKIDQEQTKVNLEEREKVLKAREAFIDSEQKKLANKKKMNELAILEQKKVDDRMLKLADDHKREKEELHKKVMELEKKLAEKQELEVEVNQLSGGIEVMKHRTDDDIEAKMNFESFKILLTDKQKEFQLALSELNKAYGSMFNMNEVLE